MAAHFFFIAVWIAMQAWWAIVATKIARRETTPVYMYAYRAGVASLWLVAFGSWWHAPAMLLLLAAWYMINVDVYVNLGTLQDPHIVDARKVSKIKFKNISCIIFILAMNLIVVYSKLLSCLKIKF